MTAAVEDHASRAHPDSPVRLLLRGPVGVAAVLGAGALALHLRDPHEHLWVLCPFKAVTGWDCPLCGGLRSVNDLGNLQIDRALHSNLLFVASVPLIAALWLVWVVRAARGRTSQVPPATLNKVMVAYVVLGAVFTVWRNTPWGHAWYVS